MGKDEGKLVQSENCLRLLITIQKGLWENHVYGIRVIMRYTI
jgi:hypothetical protein